MGPLFKLLVGAGLTCLTCVAGTISISDSFSGTVASAPLGTTGLAYRILEVPGAGSLVNYYFYIDNGAGGTVVWPLANPEVNGLGFSITASGNGVTRTLADYYFIGAPASWTRTVATNSAMNFTSPSSGLDMLGGQSVLLEFRIDVDPAASAQVPTSWTLTFHTVDSVVVPEPHTAGSIAAGLLLIASLRRYFTRQHRR